jgi:hypothetical protein
MNQTGQLKAIYQIIYFSIWEYIVILLKDVTYILWFDSFIMLSVVLVLVYTTSLVDSTCIITVASYQVFPLTDIVIFRMMSMKI